MSLLTGGAIGAELAQAFGRLGTEEITLVEGGPRLLPRKEPFAGEQVRPALEGEGVTVLLDSLLAAMRRDGNDGPVVGTRRGGNSDGLAGEEGTFLLCTFWLAQALALAGRTEQAREVFGHAARYVNDVGLLAEEIDPGTGELLGNFPRPSGVEWRAPAIGQ